MRLRVPDDGALPAGRWSGVVHNVDDWIGCRYCQLACPWDVPTAEWDSAHPEMSEVRSTARTVSPSRCRCAFNGQSAVRQRSKRFSGSIATPTCVRRAPPDALPFTGHVRRCFARAPSTWPIGQQVNRSRFTEEGLGRRNERAVPVEGASRTRLPDVRGKTVSGFQRRCARRRSPRRNRRGRHARRPSRLLPETGSEGGGRIGGHRSTTATLIRASPGDADDPVQLGLVLLVGTRRRLDRRALRLGARQRPNLSDTYPWGLWIVFDLVWIAVAAGAFAMAGVI